MRRHKYGAVSAHWGGRHYDSQGEADYARELWWRTKETRASERVEYFSCQVPFYLPAGIRYYADFVVVWVEPPRVEVHEFKGFRTPEWKLKRRLFLWQYPGLKLVEVR